MTIVITKGGGKPEKIGATSLRQEDLLQRYLADNPDVLPIEELKNDMRLMVICREFSTPSGPIDILAIDADGDIYIIETKLFKNPDKRRVVAQALDYGASLWSHSRDPATFTNEMDSATRRSQGRSLAESIAAFYEGDDCETAQTIDRLKDNLQKGVFKFIILMDQLHAPLKDLILFLNDRSQFSIYAVEIEFYKHEDIEIVIPKLFGAEVRKPISGGGKGKKWDEKSFIDAIREKGGEDDSRVAERLLKWSEERPHSSGYEIKWGSGQQDGTFYPLLSCASGKHKLFVVYTSLKVEMVFKSIPKEMNDIARKVADNLNSIPEINIPDDKLRTWKTFPISALHDDAQLNTFISAIEAFASDLGKSS